MIDSDWITTVGMVLLFAFVAFLMIRSIGDLLFDKLSHSVHFHFYHLITAAYSFLFAYSFPSKALKIAFLLLGIDVTVRVALGYLSAAAGAQHSAAIAGSSARQIAYTIILFEITRWFKSVIRRPAPPNSEVP